MECIYCTNNTDNYAICPNKCESIICWTCIHNIIIVKPYEFPKCECGTIYTPDILLTYITDLKVNTIILDLVKDNWRSKLRPNLIRNAEIEHFKKGWLATLPRAANLATKTYLDKSLNKLAEKEILITQHKYSRDCPTEHCIGIINLDMPCNICNVKECVKCRLSIKNQQNHVCTEDDILSAELVSSFKFCPNCYRRIERIDGCTAMTCAFCNTNFNIITGMEQEDGSHQKLDLIHHNNMISVKYKTKLSHFSIDNLREIEKLLILPSIPKDPNIYSLKFIIDWVTNYMKIERLQYLYFNLGLNIDKMPKDLINDTIYEFIKLIK